MIISLIFLSRQEIIQEHLHYRGYNITPNDYYRSMCGSNFVVDAMSITLLGVYLEVNIDVVTPTKVWTLWDHLPQEIVLGYNGGNNFLATSTLRST